MKINKKDNIIEVEGQKTGKNYSYEYVLPTLEVINKRVSDFINNHKGISDIDIVGFTSLGYPLNEIKIGTGPKDLFIVGGTHSNEIIAVDVISQFLEHFDEFDSSLLNDVTIHIIPIQNPEGYRVLDSLMTEVNGYIERNALDLEEFCHDYYINYRTDDLIFKSFKEMNKFMTDENFIVHYRDYIINNEAYGRLHESNALPRLNKQFPYLQEDGEALMLTFDQAILRIDPTLPLDKYLYNVRTIIMDTINKLDLNNKHDIALKIYLEMLSSSLVKPLTLINLNTITKLHQNQLKQVSMNAYNTLKNEIEEEVKDDPKLKIDFEKSYLFTCTEKQAHTIMVQFASNIIDGVNLNGNTPYSPGIDAIRSGNEVYDSRGPLSNIRNYSKEGPLGSSIPDERKAFGVINEENIDFVNENKILLGLLNKSMESDTYGGCILCHGTGGLLYYKPNEELTKNNYLNIIESNEDLVDSMQNAIDGSIEDLDPDRYDMLMLKGKHYYSKRQEADKTGFGDFLRSKFPKVIMYENSVMGGNPFSPYGDKENYVRTVNCFLKAIEAACKNISLVKKNTDEVLTK